MADTRWRITVDKGTCIGSAVCVGSVPDRFKLVNDKSEPVDEIVDADEEVLGAAESCPMEAIRVVNVDTGEVLAPEE